VKSSKKIVFFVASFSSIEATAPLGILAISTPLLNAGYDIRIIDSTITPNYKKRIMEEVKDALCLLSLIHISLEGLQKFSWLHLSQIGVTLLRGLLIAIALTRGGGLVAIGVITIAMTCLLYTSRCV